MGKATNEISLGHGVAARWSLLAAIIVGVMVVSWATPASAFDREVEFACSDAPGVTALAVNWNDAPSAHSGAATYAHGLYGDGGAIVIECDQRRTRIQYVDNHSGNLVWSAWNYAGEGYFTGESHARAPDNVNIQRSQHCARSQYQQEQGWRCITLNAS